MWGLPAASPAAPPCLCAPHLISHLENSTAGLPPAPSAPQFEPVRKRHPHWVSEPSHPEPTWHGTATLDATQSPGLTHRCLCGSLEALQKCRALRGVSLRAPCARLPCPPGLPTAHPQVSLRPRHPPRARPRTPGGWPGPMPVPASCSCLGSCPHPAPSTPPSSPWVVESGWGGRRGGMACT